MTGAWPGRAPHRENVLLARLFFPALGSPHRTSCIAAALNLLRSGGNIVTDAPHFEGSFYQYGELAKQGLNVRIARPRDWRIDLTCHK